MNTDRLFEVLSKIHPLSDDFKNAIEKEVTHLSLPRNYMLLEAAKVSEYAYYLDTGFAMTYTFAKGKKQIERFWKSGQIVISPKSFFEQLPSREFVQLQELSEVLVISYGGVMRLFNSFPEANFIYRVIMNQYYEYGREQLSDLQHLNAEDRYEKLLQTFPYIEQRIPQEYIATYLGITPQSLSRIKRQKGHG